MRIFTAKNLIKYIEENFNTIVTIDQTTDFLKNLDEDFLEDAEEGFATEGDWMDEIGDYLVDNDIPEIGKEKAENNIRTMELIGIDFWERPVYKCIETGSIWKDTTLGSDKPQLYSCGNEFDGEPDSPIKSSLEIHFTEKTQKEIAERPTEEQKFNYQMLGRLKTDCDYYLDYGCRCANRLWALDEKEQIEEMKKRWNMLSEDKKPQWLTYEQIEEYEKLMITTI